MSSPASGSAGLTGADAGVGRNDETSTWSLLAAGGRGGGGRDIVSNPASGSAGLTGADAGVGGNNGTSIWLLIRAGGRGGGGRSIVSLIAAEGNAGERGSRAVAAGSLNDALDMRFAGRAGIGGRDASASGRGGGTSGSVNDADGIAMHDEHVQLVKCVQYLHLMNFPILPFSQPFSP